MIQLLVTARMGGREDFERIVNRVIIAHGGSLIISEPKKILGEFDTKQLRQKAFLILRTIYGPTITLERIDA